MPRTYRPRGQPRRITRIDLDDALFVRLAAFAVEHDLTFIAALERCLSTGLDVETTKPAREEHEQ